jgi:2-polyprenyl-3-methyl-5-hydroxy-6-metoxy-1,4-benzoquinol methylase
VRVANNRGLERMEVEGYRESSRHRTVRVMGYLEKYFREIPHRQGVSPRILDYGSWWGNIAMDIRRAGWDVSVADFYGRYPELGGAVEEMGRLGMKVYDLEVDRIAEVDVVLFLAVIEHVAHTPRWVLEKLNRLLPAGGLLIVDTPNLAYVGNRRALNRGKSPYFPIADQYWSEIPYEGHHREYTGEELRQMMEWAGFEVLEVEYFNYAKYLTERGRWLKNPVALTEMWLDETKKELVMAVGRKR